MIKKSIPLSLALILSPSVLYAESTTRTFDANVKQLDLNNGSGNVNIVAAADGKAKVSYNMAKVDKGCVVTVDQAATVLKVSARSESAYYKSDCKVDFEIELPKTVDLNIKVGSSDVKIKDIKGKVNYSTRSGDIDFNGEATEVDGRSGSASVKLMGLNGNADLRSGSGDIDVTYRNAPKANEISIKSGSGDSTLHLPSSSKVKASLRSGSGEIANAFGDTTEADLVVKAKTGSGDLKILKTN